MSALSVSMNCVSVLCYPARQTSWHGGLGLCLWQSGHPSILSLCESDLIKCHLRFIPGTGCMEHWQTPGVQFCVWPCLPPPPGGFSPDGVTSPCQDNVNRVSEGSLSALVYMMYYHWLWCPKLAGSSLGPNSEVCGIPEIISDSNVCIGGRIQVLPTDQGKFVV